MSKREDFKGRLSFSQRENKTAGIVDLLLGTEKVDENPHITMLPVGDITPLHSFIHPYEKSMGEGIEELSEQIKAVGIQQPIVVRPDPDESGKYEILIGHRRQLAAIKADLPTIPAIIRDVDDTTAQIVVNDNLNQRDYIYPSERSAAYGMMMDALKKQGKRRELAEAIEHFRHGMPKVDENSARGLVAAAENISVRQVSNYLRLQSLIPDLMEMVDENACSVSAGADLSFLKPEEQEWTATAAGDKITSSKAAKLRTASQAGELFNAEAVEQILKPEKKTIAKSPYHKAWKHIGKQMEPELSEVELLRLEDKEEIKKLEDFIRKAIQRWEKGEPIEEI